MCFSWPFTFSQDQTRNFWFYIRHFLPSYEAITILAWTTKTSLTPQKTGLEKLNIPHLSRKYPESNHEARYWTLSETIWAQSAPSGAVSLNTNFYFNLSSTPKPTRRSLRFRGFDKTDVRFSRISHTRTACYTHYSFYFSALIRVTFVQASSLKRPSMTIFFSLFSFPFSYAQILSFAKSLLWSLLPLNFHRWHAEWATAFSWQVVKLFFQ
jgi:hypothetical protein